LFDYRGFGAGEGEPRQWLSVPRQLADYDAAIAQARGLGGIDPKRIALWGSSFSGGHVLTLGARRQDIAAIVAQAPAADLLAPVLRVPPWTNLRLFIVGLIDLLGGALGARPRHVAVVGAPGALAVMRSPDADPGYRAMLPTPTTWRNEICARAVVGLALYRPVAQAAKISAPLLVCACDGDVVTPPRAAVRAAQRAPQDQLKRYPIGHFDIYRGAGFEAAVADQVAFLRETLHVA
jgi:pimeloyl-ACP methyl ester carboxylesterase